MFVDARITSIYFKKKNIPDCVWLSLFTLLFFQAEEFFFFAVFLAVVTVIFIIMAWFYKYVNYGASRSEEVPEEEKGERNEGVVDDENLPLTSADESGGRLYPELNRLDGDSKPGTSKSESNL